MDSLAPPHLHPTTCCDLLLSDQDVLQGERCGGELVLLPEGPLPLPGDQAERLVAVSLAQARHRDQPPCVAHLLHKVVGGRREHPNCTLTTTSERLC